jgi:hypothetical protein
MTIIELLKTINKILGNYLEMRGEKGNFMQDYVDVFITLKKYAQ